MAPPKRPWQDRFWAKVQKREGCWEWTAAYITNGLPYGLFRRESRKPMVLAHRLAWEEAHGPIPAGMQVLHSCDNPRCVNVAHLFLGTPFDNMRDCAAKKRGGGNRFKRGNPGRVGAPRDSQGRFA